MNGIQQIDFNVDLLKFVFWQYDKSNVLPLVQDMQAEMQKIHTDFWQDWYRDVFDIRTCNNFGIAVWAIILDIPILITGEQITGKLAFGFGPNRANYAPPSNFGQSPEGASLLTLKQKRAILKMRYRKMISSSNPIEFNKYATEILGEGLGRIWMQVNGDMTIEYKTNFVPPPWLVYAYSTFDIWPTAQGVKASETLIYSPPSNMLLEDGNRLLLEDGSTFLSLN